MMRKLSTDKYRAFANTDAIFINKILIRQITMKIQEYFSGRQDGLLWHLTK